MLEKTIERSHAKMVNKLGISYKFVSPGVNGVPDRIHLRPIPKEHQEIVAKYIQFIEFKRKDKKPESHQHREHARIRELGFTVKVVDTL